MKYIIKELTQKQKDMLPIWRDKWIAKGLQTGETDWETFEKNIPICYEKAGFDWHGNIVRVQSPLVGAFAAAIAAASLKSNNAIGDAVSTAVSSTVAVNDAVGDAVSTTVNDAVGDAVRVAVCDAVDKAVSDAVDKAVSDAVNDAVDKVVRAAAVSTAVSTAVSGAVRVAVNDAVSSAVSSTTAVDKAVSNAVYKAVCVAVSDAVNDAVNDAVRVAVDDAVINAKNFSLTWHSWHAGQFWVGGWWWGAPSFVSFFKEVCGLELAKDIEERADAYQKICESVNYMWLNSHFTIVCARPCEIHRDDQGRLHNESGLAIKYLDNWGIYSIDGVTVDEQIVLRPETLTVKQIQEEENQEKRRIMIERHGVDKYLQAINATIVDVDLRGVAGGGARALMKDDEGDCWFIGTDGSTNRVYNMYVGKGFTSCRAAHESLCGFSEELILAEG